MSDPKSKIYTLNLTKEELWVLSQNYAAAFTDPAARDAVECRVSDKLSDLYAKAHRGTEKEPARPKPSGR